MDKGPLDTYNNFSSELLTYVIVLVVSLWGGLVSYFNKVRVFSWPKLTAHISSAGFAGMMTFLMCQSAGITGPLAGALSGIAAHMGTPALIRLLMRSKWVKQFLDEEKGTK